MELWEDENTLSYWKIKGHKGASRIKRDGIEKHSGKYCARFDIDANNTFRRLYQRFNLKTNESYTLEFWYKTDADKTCYALFINPAGYYLNSSGSWQNKWATYTGFIGNKDWTKNAISFVASHSGPYYLGIYSCNAPSSSIYIDDIRLKRQQNYRHN